MHSERQQTVKDFNALRGQGEARLQLSVGALAFAAEASVSVEDLLSQADRLRGGAPPR